MRAARRPAFSIRGMATKSSSINGKGPFEGIYQTFMRNNLTYVSTIITAAILFEAVYGKATNALWESMNRGRLYHHIDWSSFKSDDDEEDEADEGDDGDDE